MEILVQKPQFDANVLQPGKAVHIKDVTAALGAYQQIQYDTNLRDIDADAIITKVEALSISVYYLGAKKGEDNYVKIPVHLVADKKLEIKLMGVIEDGKTS